MATKTPIDAGMISRAANTIGAALRGVADWFGPGDPLPPLVNGAQQDSVRGRQFDYPVAYNRRTAPRAEENISFAQLRALADNLDVLRIVIETRKDQMAKLKWTVKPRDEKAERDKRCDEVEAFFRFPDKEHDWDTWLRMLLEELFVIDAPALYVRRTVGGDLYALEPLDGATIKRILDEHGRTPMPPENAYMQVLKGVPAATYTREELLYRPRNQRVWKIYGYSPVEQITMTINTAIRRALSVMQSYTEGNVPEALIGVPENWTVDQIRQFQTYWDSILAGESGERRRARFVPGAMKYQPTKDPVLKDNFDEWIARVVCFAFSIAPTPFIKEQNRATAETAREAALAEGLSPVMQWVKNLMDHAVTQIFGYADLEFDWDIEEAQDPLVTAQINQIYLNAGVVDPDEVRADLGKEALTDEQREKIKAARTPPPMAIQPGAEVGGGDHDDPDGDGPPGGGGKPAPGDKGDAKSNTPGAEDDAKKSEVAKAAKKRRPGPISPDRATVVKLERRLTEQIADFFKAQAVRAAGSITKADEDTDEEAKKKALKAVISVDWDELVNTITPTLEDIARDGAVAALGEIGMEDDVEIYGSKVTEWAQDRAAEMVGKKWVDGELVDNPNAQWVISDSTRDMIQGVVAGSIDDGATMDELADQLEQSFAFSPERAEMIARTETRMADMGGQMEAYQASGVVEGTEWLTANDDLVSELCQANADAGVVALGDLYPSGDSAPPAHPNCRCSVIAALAPENEE
jgi:SPP1 gp7 family putative phage head morphogenesis protein